MAGPQSQRRNSEARRAVQRKRARVGSHGTLTPNAGELSRSENAKFGSTLPFFSYSGSRRSLACAGAIALKNQSWRVFETRRDPQKTFILGARTVVFRRLTTTLSDGSWQTEAKDLRLPEQEVFAFAGSIHVRREWNIFFNSPALGERPAATRLRMKRKL